jgi:hypothetical protein
VDEPSTRIEFPAAVRNLAASRAGHRCSFPGCGRTTSGPGAQDDQRINMGIAAHIYSASPGGPRGSGGLREDERASLANAIWLCTEHGSLIDKNQGLAYPPELLLRYRDIHEAGIARELGGVKTPFGWITALHADASPLFATRTTITLGKLTLAIGNNATGKTALAEWLAGASDAHYLKRWQPDAKTPAGLHFRVDYLDPEPHTIRVSFPQGGFPQYFLDERFTIVPVAPLKILFPKDVDLRRYQTYDNGLHFLTDVLRLSEHEVLALAQEMPAQGTGKVTRVWFEEEDGRRWLHADVEGTVRGLPFGNLSGSEQTRVLMEFSILAAKQHARLRPTLLILDAGSGRFDTGWLETYGQILRAPEIPFQTIASIAPREDMEELQWAGWRAVRLKGEPPAVALSSEIRLASDNFEWKLD